jgi:outer membrane receptor protein involved in Fe transport
VFDFNVKDEMLNADGTCNINSARSPAYTTFDLQFGYQRPGQWLLAIDVFNLFDVKWNESSTTTSRGCKTKPYRNRISWCTRVYP